MPNKIFYDEDARRRILGGATILYDAVKTTMGAKGRNVIIDKANGLPATITHDGVTVARAVNIKDVDDDTLGFRQGAEFVKRSAETMGNEVGDGTTTVTVLTYHLINEAHRLIAAGHNPQLLRKGIEAAAKEALELLSEYNIDIKEDKKRIAEIATISSGDHEIGKLIADVLGKVGKEGSVTVEEGMGLDIEQDIVEGFSFDRGYVHPILATDQSRLEAVYKDAPILISAQNISSVQELVPLLEQVAQAGKKELVIIAPDIEGEALTMLVMNKLKGNFNTLAIKAPSFGERQTDILADIATFTGATVLTEESGMTTSNVDLSVLGSAKKVISTANKTTIVQGHGAKEDIDSRVSQLNSLINEATNEFDKENLIKRRAALTGKVAVIKVGGLSETEIDEKKYRVDDAVAAAKAALKEGILAGGGVTLLNISKELRSVSDNESERAGIEIFRKALTAPFITLMENSNINPHAWLSQVASKKGQGINVNNPDTLVDMVKSGVIDPTRVTREALRTATSNAATVITMGALFVEIPEEHPQLNAPMMR